MRFKSRDGKEKRVASTTGHVVLIGNEFVEVPVHMEGEAFMAGCLSEEVLKGLTADKTPPPPTPDRTDAITTAMNNMMDSEDPTAFTKKGLPNKKTLDTLCGFAVTAEEFDSIWAAVSAADEVVESDENEDLDNDE